MDEKMNSTCSSANDLSDKRPLMSDEEVIFAKMYNKLCPFLLFSVVNWFLLLVMLVYSSIGYSFPLGDWDQIRGWDRMPIIIGIVLFLNSVPKISKWFSAQKQRNIDLPTLGIMDICFTMITVVCMVVVAIFYAIQSYNIFRDFSPQLFALNSTGIENENQTLELLSDNYFGENRYYHGGILPSYKDGQLESVGARLLVVHAVLNPTMSIFAMISILLSLFNALYLCLAFKKSNIWLSNYRDHFTDCAEFDAKYAKFWPYGLLKAIRWVFPTLFLFFCIFARFYTMDLLILIWLDILSTIAFFEWTLHMQKTKLRLPKSAPAKSLSTYAIWDNLLSLVTIVFYLVQSLNIPYYMHGYGEKLCYAGIAISSTLLISTTVLIFKNGGNLNGANGYLALPQISIQISVNVIKNEPKSGETEVAKE